MDIHNFRPGRTASEKRIAPKDHRMFSEYRAVDRAHMKSHDTMAPSFSEHLRRFEEILEVNLVIFVGGV